MKSYLKEPRLENPHLLLMARNQPRPCLIQKRGVCRSPGREVNCCACHGNSSIYNKGKGLKAHDFFSVWGCSWCHTWMDSSYSASGEDRQQAFRYALPRQIVEWSRIVTDPWRGNAKDRASAEWALKNLAERGYARLESGVYVPDLVLPWSLDATI